MIISNINSLNRKGNQSTKKIYTNSKPLTILYEIIIIGYVRYSTYIGKGIITVVSNLWFKSTTSS